MGAVSDAILMAELLDLKAKAQQFRTDAFNQGHYPNPMSHGVVSCQICLAAIALAALDKVEA